MSFARRIVAVCLGILVASWILGDPARGDAGAMPGKSTLPPDGPTVTLQLADGSTVTGTLRTDEFRIRTSYGVAEIETKKIRTLFIDPAVGEDPPKAHVELTDKSRLSGSALTDLLTVQVGNEPRPFKPSTVRQITFARPVNPSLAAAILGLITLAVMEIVLGVDNIIFLAILAGKLPTESQPRARRIGLLAALGTRLLLLASLSWLLGLTRPLFTLPELPFIEDPEARGISLRDLILLVGGSFLIGKSTFEMHEKMEHARKHGNEAPPTSGTASFGWVIVQIAIIDIVFSLDSVITAIGMVEQLWVMVVAMIIAVIVMMLFATPISNFVDHHPTIKVLALSFLILIGVLLVAEGLGQHLDKGYIYFAMAFSVVVELINMQLRGKPQSTATVEASPTGTG